MATIDSDELQNMLSHLNKNCNGQNINYLMQPGLDITTSYTAIREYTLPELQILCELGYNVNSPNLICDGCFVAAHSENAFPIIEEDLQNCCINEFYTCVNEPLVIDGSSLTCNDITNPSGGTLEVTRIWASVQSSPFLNIQKNGDQFTITSTAGGLFTLRYTIEGCDCRMHNLDFTIFVDNCPTCDNDPCENLLCVDDFEDIVLPTTAGIETHLGFPFKFKGTSNNSSDIKIFDNNQYLHMLAAPSNGESVALELSEGVAPDCSLEFICDVSSTIPNDLIIWGSEFPPCSMYDVFVNYGCIPTDCQNETYAPGCIGMIEISGNGSSNPIFEQKTLNFTNNFSFPINFIIISSSNWNVNVDNVSLTKTCIDPEFSYDLTCPDLLVNFTPNDIDPINTHHWDFEDNTTSTDLSPSHQYSSEGTFTVTHTVTDDCGHSKEFVETVVVSCAQYTPCISTAPGALVIGKDVGLGELSDVDPQDLATYNQYIIAGSFDIDENYSFHNKEFFMEPGSEIVIQPYFELTLNSCSLIACDAMWKGITPEELSTLTVKDSYIADAQYAINPLDLANLEIQGTRFDKNYIALNITATVNLTAPLKRNDFACDGDLVTPYPDQTPAPGLRTYAGIYLNGVAEFTVGEENLNFPNPYPTQDFNVFDGLYNGIISERSNLTCFNNRFTNMLKSGTISGYGIYAPFLGNSFTLEVGNENYFENFEIGGIGIFTLIDSKIDNVNMTNLDNGIIAYFSPSRGLEVTNSELMNCRLQGISISSSPYLWNILLDQKELIIDNNIIEVEHYITGNPFEVGLSGISLSGVLPLFQSDALTELKPKKITNNIITISDTKYGIQVIGVNDLSLLPDLLTGDIEDLIMNGGVLIENNTITAELFAPTASGIYLGGAPRTQIRSNTIIGNNTGIGAFYGIHLINSRNTAFCCNNLSGDGLKTGVRVEGMCESEDIFKQNTYGIINPSGTSGIYDLYILPAGVLGNQNTTGNLWSTNSTVRHDGTSTELFMSRFFVELGTGFEPDDIFTPNSSDNWFLNSPVTADLCAAVPKCEIPDLLLNDQPSDITKQLAEGIIETSIYSKSIRWETSQDLFKQLSANSNLLNQSTDLQNFYTDSESNNIGSYNQVNQSMADLFKINSFYGNVYSNYDGLIKQKLSSIREKNQKLINAIPSEKITIVAEKKILLQELSNALIGFNMIDQSIKANRYQAIDDIIADNQSLSSVEIFESNEKTVNDIYLSTIAKDNYELDHKNITDLLAIANQCPVEGGNAVYNARAILNFMSNENYTFSDDNCYSRGNPDSKRIGGSNNDIVNSAKYNIYPNPADDYFTIEYIEGRIGNKIELVDIVGKTVFSQTINNEKARQEIRINELPEGVYFCRIYDEKLEVFTSKIVILE